MILTFSFACSESFFIECKYIIILINSNTVIIIHYPARQPKGRWTNCHLRLPTPPRCTYPIFNRRWLFLKKKPIYINLRYDKFITKCYRSLLHNILYHISYGLYQRSATLLVSKVTKIKKNIFMAIPYFIYILQFKF